MNPLLDPAPATAEEQAYRYLLGRIRMGELKPGDRVVPEEVAAEIGMSRMPVRDAFRRLATQELLTIRPNRGAVVRGLDPAELVEVFEMRAVLEGLAAASAMKAIGSAELKELEHRLEMMEERADNVSDWVGAHRDFHLYLCSFSGKPRLLAQISALHLSIEPHMRLWLQAAAKPLSSHEDHGLILDALKRRRPELVETVVRDHVCATIPDLLALMGAPHPGAGEESR
ncbi:MAG TPA: GntR family transcriptional regulator [Ramlibacter sp.]|uniref:GntR family transcriptional regulator n=1 Tax=Ramlibacter sp. TaxID=1917967 RepID=UPI002D7FCF7E|nr:GntR family transcriptional regulator [Ramlibacter sp.]HET8745673.1 GntR family transcriptional regulator [Ramlibacter sp.]